MSKQHPRLEAPEQIAEEFARAWNAADAESLADLFTAEADFVNVVDEPGGARLPPVSYQRTRTGPQAAANGEVRPGT